MPLYNPFSWNWRGWGWPRRIVTAGSLLVGIPAGLYFGYNTGTSVATGAYEGGKVRIQNVTQGLEKKIKDTIGGVKTQQPQTQPSQKSQKQPTSQPTQVKITSTPAKQVTQVVNKYARTSPFTMGQTEFEDGRGALYLFSDASLYFTFEDKNHTLWKGKDKNGDDVLDDLIIVEGGISKQPSSQEDFGIANHYLNSLVNEAKRKRDKEGMFYFVERAKPYDMEKAKTERAKERK